jgi:hypothetical protein
MPRLLRPALLIVAIVAGVSSGDSGDLSSAAGMQPPNIEMLIEVLRAREESMRRCQISYTVDHQDWGPSVESQQKSLPSVQEVLTHKETDWDGMRRVETHVTPKDTRQTDEWAMVETCDRTQYRRLDVHIKAGTISSDPKRFGLRDFGMILNGFAGSLADELETNAREPRVAIVPYGDSQAVLVEWKSGNWNRRLYLDPERQLVPICVENGMDSSTKVRQVSGYVRTVGRRTVEEFGTIDGVLVPSRASLDHFAVLEDGKTRPLTKETIRLVEFGRLSQKPPPDTFRLVFPVGTRVTLVDVGTSFMVGGDPKEADQTVKQVADRAIADETTEPGGERQQVSSAAQEGGGDGPQRSPPGSSPAAAGEHPWKALWGVVLAVAGVALLMLGWLKIRRRPVSAE